MSAAVAPSSSASSSPMQFAQPRSFINLNHSEPRQPSPPKQQQHSPIEPPQGISYAEFLRSWTDAHVARWLVEIKCGTHDESFKANDIRGDILLDLDQETLREIGVASIGDRLRILNAVKILRQRVAGKPAPPQRISQRIEVDSNKDPASKPAPRRLDTMRPTPLPLSNRSELPDIVPQQGPDSAKSIAPLVRPLPQPTQSSTPPSAGQVITPSTAHSAITTHTRPSKLPALPPPPKGQPPLPPGRARNLPPWPKVEPPAYTNQPPPPPPQNQSQLTPGGNRQLLSDSRSSNSSTMTRSISPTPQVRPRANPSTPNLHGRSGSLSSAGNTYSPNKPSNRPSHPYANAQLSVNNPSNNPAHTLSPIDESFVHQSSSTPPGAAYTVGRGPFNPGSMGSPYTVDDFRRKFVKVVVPDEGHSFTLDVAACNGGVEVLEKVLKKFGKTTKNEGNLEATQADEGGLVVDGWGIFMDMGTEGNPGQPLTEGELLAICHAPDHPTRESGLVLRRVQNSVKKNIKRASTVSILSGLGVRYPDQTLAPPSPTQPASGKRSKLRNFFGQRPPSELITTHLTDFFPNAEKKVLARTARNSMMFRSGTTASRRESNASMTQPPLASRFSNSTQGSAVGRRSYSPSRASISTVPPPVPEKPSSASGSPYDTSPTDDLPRVSLSTDDGRSVDLHIDGGGSGGYPSSSPSKRRSLHSGRQSYHPQHHLPPIPFPSESLSESIDDGIGSGSEAVSHPSQQRMSRAMSIASKRMSYMTELRSKRDKSDTASVMTVDQITANVESRRESKVDLEGWTKVGSEIESMVPQAVAGADLEEEDDIIASDSDEELVDSDEDVDGDEDETLREEEDELALDVDDDGVIRDVVSRKTKKAKWIKGALIGAGSFGKVYLGMDASTGFLMAVKQVELPKGSGPNQERKKSMLSALEREIELLKNLEHENIVQYLYSAIEDEYLNIFLEYVPGGSVTALLQDYGAFEEVLVKNFVRQILQGLNYLHERDIIHRDIKGANILVDNRGGIKISDFGISKKVDDNLLTGNRMNRPSLQGSVFWMAPEVVKQTGHTRKADIWSVGCLVVEMLTGEHPWAQLTQMQAIFKIGSSAKPTIPSDISTEAQDFLQRTFEIDHEARPTAAELLQHPWIVSLGNAVLKPSGA